VGSFAATQRADNGQVSRGSSCLTDGRRLACFRSVGVKDVGAAPQDNQGLVLHVSIGLVEMALRLLSREQCKVGGTLAHERDAAGTGVEPNAGGDRAARVPKRDAKTLVGWKGCWSGAGCLQLGLVAERDDVFG
jgi:hypothetical protein